MFVWKSCTEILTEYKGHWCGASDGACGYLKNAEVIIVILFCGALQVPTWSIYPTEPAQRRGGALSRGHPWHEANYF